MSAQNVLPALTTVTRDDFEAIRVRVDNAVAEFGFQPEPDEFGDTCGEYSQDDFTKLRAWTAVRVALFNAGSRDAFELQSVVLDSSGRVDARFSGEGFDAGRISFEVLPESRAGSLVSPGDVYGDVKKFRLPGEAASRATVVLNVQEPYWHAPLAPQHRKAIAKMRAAFGDFYPLAHEQWEEWFRRTLLIRTELGLWLGRAEAFRHFTSGKALSPKQQAHYFKAIHVYSMPGHHAFAFEAIFRRVPADFQRAVYEFCRLNHSLFRYDTLGSTTTPNVRLPRRG